MRHVFELHKKDIEAITEAMYYCAGASVGELQERYKHLALLFEAELEMCSQRKI